ncbi:MAG: hypothetical protein D6806_05060 [Deltaproteobacteria bacterium]|nr:MAG: hypothetical protein D6806_05060 [Deltaproteobacteria bacterium]
MQTKTSGRRKFEPEDVIGHSLFDFIDGVETRYLYRILFDKARSEKKRVGPIPFRCDSPQERRFLELTLDALQDDSIKIVSILVRSEPREEVDLLKVDVPRSKDLLVICSMCKKIELPSKEWVDIEEGLVRLGIFEKEKMPALSHGLCEDCMTEIMKLL